MKSKSVLIITLMGLLLFLNWQQHQIRLYRVSRMRCNIFSFLFFFFVVFRCLHKLAVNDIFTTRIDRWPRRRLLTSPLAHLCFAPASFFSSSSVFFRGPRQVREFVEVNMANKLLRRFLARWFLLLMLYGAYFFFGSISVYIFPLSPPSLPLSPSPFLPCLTAIERRKKYWNLCSNCFQFQRFASIFHV